ncbi:NST UDP-N-acetylglucosamine transporter [Colletotrichum graminicola]|nr:NST UDP-N-acetylglucosamine transporter [Colletotrichum graminicola]
MCIDRETHASRWSHYRGPLFSMDRRWCHAGPDLWRMLLKCIRLGSHHQSRTREWYVHLLFRLFATACSSAPRVGTLLTFVQFLFVAVTGYFSQFDRSRPPFFLQEKKVPLRRWIINIVLFFGINVLNNHAFSYDISVPVHIILRSGGSITTMIAGTLYGKKYSRIQILAVILLTIGVITAAWSDAQSKASGIAWGEIRHADDINYNRTLQRPLREAIDPLLEQD